MDFLKRLFSPTVVKSYLGGTWTIVSGNDVTEKNLLGNNKEWVFIAVDKNANAVSSVRFKVMRYERNGDDQEVFDGPLVEFLENPAQGFSGKDLIYLSTAYKELCGNSFWEILPGGKVKPLIPIAVAPDISPTGQLLGYRYTGEGKERYIKPDKVLHDRYVDPRKPFWGVGRLEKIGGWVDTTAYANALLQKLWANGAHFGGFIETEEESEERIRIIKAGLVNDHVGVEKAGKWAVLPKGSKATPNTANLHTMQFQSLDEGYRDKILSAFGVPKTLIGFTTEVNRASAEASEYIYAKYTVKPIVDKFIDFLNNSVTPLFDTTGKYYFAYEEFVPENVEAKLKERELSLAGQAYRTVNEVRAELGLPPVQGGDTIYGSMGLPLGQKPPALPTGDPKDDKKPKKAAPPRARAMERKERLIEEIIEKAAGIPLPHIDRDAESHKTFVTRVDGYEKMLAEKVRDFNNRQERDVLLNLARITKAVAKTDLYDMEKEVGVLVDFVTPLLKGLITEQAIEEYLAQQFEGSFDPEASSLSHIVELAAKRMAQSYNDTTANLLKSALNDGIKAGETTAELAARVQEIYAFSDKVRAEAVARTESYYIANEGSREAYKQSGVVKSVRWYTSEDERVCEFCGPMDGRIVDINEVFFKKGDTFTGSDGKTMSMDYRTIDVPPLHTRCRCFVRPERIEV